MRLLIREWSKSECFVKRVKLNAKHENSKIYKKFVTHHTTLNTVGNVHPALKPVPSHLRLLHLLQRDVLFLETMLD